MTTITVRTLAYVLRGDWVATCPRDECGNVEFLDFTVHRASRCTRDTFYCSYCNMIAGIVWPANPDEIWEPLARRPVPHTRNWYPANHPDAVKFRVEHGQTAADLWQENREHGVA
jgi:hypothetical protein